MSNPEQTSPTSVSSALTLANAVAIVIGVARGLASSSVASSLNGRSLTTENVAQAACVRITQKLNERIKQAQELRLERAQ